MELPTSEESHNYFHGRELLKEVRKQYGHLTDVELRQSYAELQKADPVTGPKQKLIDEILARRKIQQFDQKQHNITVKKKLQQDKECLNKELEKLRLKRRQFQDASLSTHENNLDLQTRIQQIMKNQPHMKTRVKQLREEYEEDAKTILELNIFSSPSNEEPYHTNNIKMVHALLEELVEQVMDDYLRRVPEGMDPSAADQLSWKRMQEAMKEVTAERAVQLTMEQYMLEVTRDLSKCIALECYNVDRLSQVLAFDIIFNPVKEEAEIIVKELAWKCCLPGNEPLYLHLTSCKDYLQCLPAHRLVM
ncbi:uncharacterized protein LOC122793427 [Protopterus annectens]|uniref:uncharacterized protein LOC122793427 n=1 Tax=Protopterus annectens TaxID=7888 RepID=UPI001CF937F9|nr:uncharacterized protein LOC122793427 [Protopterus annectens]